MDSLEDLSRRSAAGRTDFAAQAARARSRFVGNGRGIKRLVVVALFLLAVARLFTVAWLMDVAWDWSLGLPLPDAVDRWLYPGARPARPIDRAGWLTEADYPDVALVLRPSGTLVIRVLISHEGRVTDCWTERSSDSGVLDDAACRLVMRRARYLPARDQDGRTIASEAAMKVRWTAPPVRGGTTQSIPIGTGEWRVVTDLHPGRPPECRIVQGGREEALKAADCLSVARAVGETLKAARIAAPVRIAQDYRNALGDASPAPLPALPPGWRQVIDVRNRAFLSDGHMQQCAQAVDAADPAVRRAMQIPPPCDTTLRFSVDGRGGVSGHLLLQSRLAVQQGGHDG